MTKEVSFGRYKQVRDTEPRSELAGIDVRLLDPLLSSGDEALDSEGRPASSLVNGSAVERKLAVGYRSPEPPAPEAVKDIPVEVIPVVKTKSAKVNA